MFFFVLPASEPRPEVVKVKVVPVAVSSSRAIVSIPPVVCDAEAFKRTIIDNNLFRPLGWRPPRPIEPYRLIGTLLPRAANTPPKAIMQFTAGQQTYIVSTGEQLDASTEVVSIQGKSVVLETDREQRTLHLPIGF